MHAFKHALNANGYVAATRVSVHQLEVFLSWERGDNFECQQLRRGCSPMAEALRDLFTMKCKDFACEPIQALLEDLSAAATGCVQQQATHTHQHAPMHASLMHCCGVLMQG